MRQYQKCKDCGNDTFYVYRDSEDSIGTLEECSECDGDTVCFDEG